METPTCSKIPELSVDWKLNPNVECRIILNKLKIKTPEYGTMEFCRTLRNLSVPIEPTHAVSTTTDMHFKSEFVLDVLLNEILGKCGEKCKVCEEYVQQLRHHIIQAHSGHPNPSPHPQTVTVFKCDVCSSIYSSPSMLIRHRNTRHSDPLTTACTNESVRFEIPDKNRISISTSFDVSSVTRRNNSVSSHQCEIHPQESASVPPCNLEWNCLKQEEPSSIQSQVEISNPNSLGILQHMNHLSTIENNLKQECDELHDPLLLQDLQVPSFVKYECTETCTKSEEQTISMTHVKSYDDTPSGRESVIIQSDLIRHKITQRQTTGKKPNKCDICGKCFNQSQYLTVHKLVHTGVRPYKCDVCGKCFAYNNVLKQHRLTHTGEKPFRCDVCGRDFLQISHLKRHRLTHTGERPHKCDVCGQGFSERSLLNRHKSIHTREKPHKCDLCGKCFIQNGNLARHKLTHTRERPYKCDVCGKCFIQNGNLTLHKLTHTGERPHKCDVCGQGFSGRSLLTRHKSIHMEEKPHKCDLCGKSFRQSGNLTRHKVTHMRERPHKCDVCGKCFLQSGNLTLHKLTHTGENSFHCDVCGQNIHGRDEITQHKLTHAWESTTSTLVNHLKEERESEEEGCKEDPLLNLNLEVSVSS